MGLQKWVGRRRHGSGLVGLSTEATIRRHPRARRLTLSVYPDGRVVLTAPRSARMYEIEAFLREKAAWIRDALAKLVTGTVRSRADTRAHYLAHREEARTFVTERVEHWARIYNVSYRRISIRNQVSCWGSCTGKGSLNFNYSLLFLPRHLADYVVVHELCHLRELNHSRRFWALVAQTMPEYDRHRRELRQWRPGAPRQSEV